MADLSDSRVNGRDGLPIRATLQRTFTVFRRQAGRFLLLAGLAALPTCVALLSGGGVSQLSLWLASALDYLIGLIVQGSAMVLAVGAMRKRPAGLARAGTACLRCLVPLLAVTVVLSLPDVVRFAMFLGLGLELPTGWGLAFALLGLLVLAIGLPAGPACLSEGLGVRESLHRGFALGAAYWRESLALLIIVKVMAAATTALFRSGMLLATQPGSMIDPRVFLVAAQIAAAVWLVIAAVLAAVVYCTLRAVDGGDPPGPAADVFD